jgi:hypothetical protein
MRRILMLLLCVMALSASFLLVGCLGGGSQGQEGGHEQHATHKQKGGGEKDHGSHGHSHGQRAKHEQHPIEKACREEPKHPRVFDCEPMAMVGVVYDVQMQPERDRQTYEHALAHIDRVVPDDLAIQVYFYSGKGDYREKNQNAVATVSVAGEYSVGHYGKSAPPLDGKLEPKDK